jgi:hypothetical protein
VKQGDLVRVFVDLAQHQTSQFHGRVAIVLGDEGMAAGISVFIKVLCDGPRMMPLHWLREIDDA